LVISTLKPAIDPGTMSNQGALAQAWEPVLRYPRGLPARADLISTAPLPRTTTSTSVRRTRTVSAFGRVGSSPLLNSMGNLTTGTTALADEGLLRDLDHHTRSSR
jgi:hypothetical protein